MLTRHLLTVASNRSSMPDGGKQPHCSGWVYLTQDVRGGIIRIPKLSDSRYIALSAKVVPFGGSAL